MNQIKVKNIFVAVFEKSVLDGLLEVLDRQADRVGPFDSRTDLEIGQIRFWGSEGTIRYVKSKGFWGKFIIRGFDYGGRVKSLDRVNFVRILADRSNKKHLKELKREFSLVRHSGKRRDSRIDSGQARITEAEPFDLVIVDLYAPDPKIFPESMDIGGQSLIRSAIKNYKNVALAFDEKSIRELVSHLKANQGSTLLSFRKVQAKKAAKFIAERTRLEAKMFEKSF